MTAPQTWRAWLIHRAFRNSAQPGPDRAGIGAPGWRRYFGVLANSLLDNHMFISYNSAYRNQPNPLQRAAFSQK